MHPKRFAAAIFAGRHAIGDSAYAVIEKWRVDKACPDIQCLDQFTGEPAEPPRFVGAANKIVGATQQPVIEIDHALDEFRCENADAAVVQKIDPRRLSAAGKNGVVAEMR